MNKQEFLSICAPVAELVEAKGGDYQNKVTLEQYFPFDEKSYIHMLNTKVLRLISLASKSGEPTFESTQDSVHDLMAYSVFFLKFLNAKSNANFPPSYISPLAKPWKDPYQKDGSMP
jgi:hypothetical protein